MRIGDEHGLRVAPGSALRADFPAWDAGHGGNSTEMSEGIVDTHMQDMEGISNHMAFAEHDTPSSSRDVVQVNYDRWSNLHMARVKNPDSTLLALAEHYAYARWDASRRALGVAEQALIVPGYTAGKAVLPDKLIQTSEEPPTPASAQEVLWGLLGALAGFYDYLRKRESWEMFREGVDRAVDQILEGKAQRLDGMDRETRDHLSGKPWS